MNFTDLITSADSGNVEAQIEVGKAYESGNAPGGINYDLCYKYYRMAADQGDSTGENNLGWCYEKGYGVELNYEEALRWYEKSAAKNNGYAASNAAHMYISGLGVKPDMEKALHYTIIGAQFEVPICLYNLGFWYLTGNQVEQNLEKAQKLIEAAASQGHTMAQQLMESCNGDLSKIQIMPDNPDELQHGVEVFNAGKKEEGLKIVHSEIDKGNPDAMLLFAKMINVILEGEKYILLNNPTQKKIALGIIDSAGQQNANESPKFKDVIVLPQNIWIEDPSNIVHHYIQEAAKAGNKEAMEILDSKKPDSAGNDIKEGNPDTQLTKSLLFGCVSSVIGVVVSLCLCYFISNFFIPLILCGCIVGFAVRLTGNRYDNSLMVIGGIFSALSCLISLYLICLVHDGDFAETLISGAWIPLLMAIVIGAYQSKNNEILDNPK